MTSRKIFEHAFFPKITLERVNIDGKRHYVTPEGNHYKSVTTVLGDKLDKTGLMEWRRRVGEQEADRISNQAAVRGTAIHSLCEKYLMNDPFYPVGAMPVNISTFKKMRNIIDEHVSRIYGVEYFLYSDTLMTAGATDCIADWDGVPTIVDFKTSRKLKKEEWIESYFLQASCYAMMAEERLGMAVPQIAILIAVDQEEPQLFVKDIAQFKERVVQIFTSH